MPNSFCHSANQPLFEIASYFGEAGMQRIPNGIWLVLNGGLESLTKKQLSNTEGWNTLCIGGTNGRLEQSAAAFSKKTLKANDHVRGRSPTVMLKNALDIRK